jgi:hypothetical protein
VAAFFIPMLVALLAFFLWLVVVALLVRPFGVQLPLGPFRFDKRARALQAPTFSQYLFVCGVLCFGCGMLIVTTLSKYLEWKYFHGSSVGLVASLLPAFVEYPLMAGVLFGLISWNIRSGQKRFYEKVIKVKADVAALLMFDLRHIPEKSLRWDRSGATIGNSDDP